MNFKTMFTAGIFAAASICVVSAAEVAAVKTAADLTKTATVSVKNAVATIKGSSSIAFSSKAFAVKPGKKYKVTAEVKTISGTPGTILLGLAPLDAKGKAINSIDVNVMTGSETELAVAAKKGDKVLTVKNASKWNKASAYSAIVFNAKADFSDLPNREQAKTVKGKIVKKGNVWEITLVNPLAKAYAAGTKVRQQCSGNGYIYTFIKGKLPVGQSAKASAFCSGISKAGTPGHQFWAGTKSAKLIIMQLGGKNPVAEIKNFKVEEL